MALSVTHPYVSAIPDSGDTSLVQPSNWNAAHSIAGLGTGVETALGVNVGSAGAFVTNNAANSFTANQSIAAGTLTTDVKVLDLSATWDAGTTVMTGLKFNITDTASGATSLLMDLQVGGTSKFKFEKSGDFYFGPSGNNSIRTTNTTRIYLYGGTTNVAYFNTSSAYAQLQGVAVGGTMTVPDTFILRDAANTLAQRNGTNAQTFNLYNTYTDASNYERGFVRFSSNVLEIGMEKAGTGTQRDTKILRGTDVHFWAASGQSVIGNNGAPIVTFGITSAATSGRFGFNSGTQFLSVADGIFRVTNAATTSGGTMELIEQTAPAAGAANSVRIYAQDNGAGKTQLMALFASGAAQQIAIEP